MAGKRSLKNVALTRRFHWAYFGDWVVLNTVLVVVAEAFFLVTLKSLIPSNLPFDPIRLSAASVAIALVVVLGLFFLGAWWAHRIAGVHIRMEKVLRRVAEGDLSVSLRFRDGDDLDEVEGAFESMMATLRGEQGEKILEEGPITSQERDRRSLQNMVLTSRYHYKYMAIWVLVSVLLLAAAYATGVLCLYVLNYSGGDFRLTPLVWVATILAGCAGAYLVWRGFRTSHRLAGVHVKLARTFQQVAQGRKDVDLRFRSYDKLEAIEEAFQALMVFIRSSKDSVDSADRP
jgi:HAMP domain